MKTEVVGSIVDGAYILAYGLFAEDEMREACLSVQAIGDYGETAIPDPRGGRFEWGAYRWRPAGPEDEYTRWLEYASELESPFGQFFATVWHPAQWIPSASVQQEANGMTNEERNAVERLLKECPTDWISVEGDCEWDALDANRDTLLNGQYEWFTEGLVALVNDYVAMSERETKLIEALEAAREFLSSEDVVEMDYRTQDVAPFIGQVALAKQIDAALDVMEDTA